MSWVLFFLLLYRFPLGVNRLKLSNWKNFISRKSPQKIFQYGNKRAS